MDTFQKIYGLVFLLLAAGAAIWAYMFLSETRTTLGEHTKFAGGGGWYVDLGQEPVALEVRSKDSFRLTQGNETIAGIYTDQMYYNRTEEVAGIWYIKEGLSVRMEASNATGEYTPITWWPSDGTKVSMVFACILLALLILCLGLLIAVVGFVI